jgi:hypothetical protein
MVDAIWALTQLKGPEWSEYQKLLDLAYGDAINTDASNYLTGLANAPEPSREQLVYTMAADQPNNLAWRNPYSAGDVNGPGPPSEAIYAVWGNYAGSIGSWRSHWENTYVNYAANHSYGSNSMPDYGTQLTDSVVDLILHPPRAHLITVCSKTWAQSGCRATYNQRTGQWTLRWTPPSGVTEYYLKENDTKFIVDNIGWSNATNQPLDRNIAQDYNWFAVGNHALAPPRRGADSITVSAPGTAHFMLKAFVLAASATRNLE